MSSVTLLSGGYGSIGFQVYFTQQQSVRFWIYEVPGKLLGLTLPTSTAVLGQAGTQQERDRRERVQGLLGGGIKRAFLGGSKATALLSDLV
jgi:hypothetical protein